jgi:hypothetical protein
MDNHNMFSFNATANPEDEAQSYAACVNNKATLLKFDKWAKFQTCHHCGNKGHVCPNCRKYLAEKANGTLPPPGKKRLTRPATAFNKYHHEKLQKDPKLKALLLHSQPSPPNILLTHSLRQVRLRPTVMTTMILQAAQKMRMASMLFGAWWEL